MAPVTTAVILAAGAGTRFWPYNVVRQKAAFPIANIPNIRRLAAGLAQQRIERLIAVVGHGAASVRAALRQSPIPVTYVVQHGDPGTATAALAGCHDLDEDVLIVAGDVVTDPQNFGLLLDRFEHEPCQAAALIQPLGNEAPNDWLVAHPEGGLLRGVEGHPRSGAYRLCGIYALRKSAFAYLADNPGVMSRVPVGGMPPLESEIAQSIQMMIDEGLEIAAVETTSYHVDLDKPWHILQATQQVMHAMQQDPPQTGIPASSSVADSAEIDGNLVLGERSVIGSRVVARGDVWLADGARVENGAILDGPVIVGADTVVRDYAQIGGYSVLGSRGIYGHGAEFSGVALERVYCYHYCEIWGVVGTAVDFGAATVCGNLRFDDADSTWRVKGRREVPRMAANAAYLGDFCRTGVNAILMPGIRIGVYSCVGPGVLAYEDIADNQLVLARQELDVRPWGPEKYGW